jgi:magnesium-transporting ATPase (P-type)
MSVLVRDKRRNKYFIFVKGSPEKILQNSFNIAPNSENS